MMWRLVLIVLCATGISMAVVGREGEKHAERRIVRRYACPVGFFRLKRFCYYLSGGAASWKEAYFHCRDRNATLAELDRRGKDGSLRRYLLGEQFTKLERWIGGIYNWRLMLWEWGVRGEKMNFENFARPLDPKELAWQCTVLDPTVRYKWTPRSCYDRKHYICQAPAARLAARSRGKPRGSKLRRKTARKEGRRSRTGASTWAQGRNLGTSQTMMRKTAKRRGPTTLLLLPSVQQTSATVTAPARHYDVFQGDGPSNSKPQSIADVGTLLANYHSRINDIAREEILLKP